MSKFIFMTEWTDLLQGCREWVRLEVYEGIIEYVRTGTPPKLRTQAGAVLRCIIREIERDGLILSADDDKGPSSVPGERKGRSPLQSAQGAECGATHTQTEKASDLSPRARVISFVNDNINNKNNKEKNRQKKENAASSVPDSLFVSFYSLYGKDVDKEKVWRRWRLLTEEERKKIMEYVPLYVAATPNKRYRRSPLTFLERRTWENELPSVGDNAGNVKEQQRKFEQQSIALSIEKARQKEPTEEEKRENRRQQLLGYVRAVKENPKSMMRSILVGVKKSGELDSLGIEWNES